MDIEIGNKVKIPFGETGTIMRILRTIFLTILSFFRNF